MPPQIEGAPAGTGAPGGETPPESRPASETPAAGAPSPSSSAGSASGSEDDLSDLPEGTPANVRELIRKERATTREAERRAGEATRKLTERERAEMSELDRTKSERDAERTERERLQSELRRRDVADEIAALAPRVGISDHRLAARLLDMDSLEFDGDGKPKGLQTKLTALKAEYPILATRTVGSADGGASPTGGANEDDINARIRSRARTGR
jgi:hypothetical protein